MDSGEVSQFKIGTLDSLNSDDKKEKNSDAKSHEEKTTFARIFANDLANSVIKDDKPVFPVGSVIVREKLLKADDKTPEVLTVMVKRKKGFSKKTGDWEYFVLSGDRADIKQREKVGSCSKCHAAAKENDFVFRDFLK